MEIFSVLLSANITTVFHRWCFSITVQIYNKDKDPCKIYISVKHLFLVEETEHQINRNTFDQSISLLRDDLILLATHEIEDPTDLIIFLMVVRFIWK